MRENTFTKNALGELSQKKNISSFSNKEVKCCSHPQSVASSDADSICQIKELERQHGANRQTLLSLLFISLSGKRAVLYCTSLSYWCKNWLVRKCAGGREVQCSHSFIRPNGVFLFVFILQPVSAEAAAVFMLPSTSSLLLSVPLPSSSSPSAKLLRGGKGGDGDEENLPFRTSLRWSGLAWR